jgi:death-on-curing protein
LPDESEIFYLELSDVVDLHEDILRLTGQSPQRVDIDKLEGAVMRLRMAAFYDTPPPDIISQAVLLCVAISQAQAFVDGNKRTAVYATDIFLRQNGYALPKNFFQIIHWLERIAKRSTPDERDYVIEAFDARLRQIVKKINPYSRLRIYGYPGVIRISKKSTNHSRTRNRKRR